MTESKIENMTTIPFTATYGSGVTSFYFNGTYNMLSKIISFSMVARGSITQSTVVANMPTEYRPSASVTIPCWLQANNGSSRAGYYVTLDTNGDIKQNFSGSVSDIFIVGSYQI